MTIREKTLHIESLDNRPITLRMLRASEVDTLMAALQDGKLKVTSANLLFTASAPIEAVAMSTGLTVEELLGSIYPDELEAIWRAVEEINPFLLKVMTKLKEAAATIMMQERSKGLPAGLSGTGTPGPTSIPGISSSSPSMNSANHCADDNRKNGGEAGKDSQRHPGLPQQEASKTEDKQAERG